MAEAWGIWCMEGYWSDARAGEAPGPDPLDEGDTAAHFNSKADAEAGIERRHAERAERYYEARPLVPPSRHVQTSGDRQGVVLLTDVDDMMGVLRCIASGEYTLEQSRALARGALERLKVRGIGA
jgi:hypothetical protein